MILDVVKVFIPAALSFFIGILATPLVAGFLYRHELWKKKARTVTTDGREAKVFNSLHATREVGTPKMGGAIIWISALATTLFLWVLARGTASVTLDKLDFLSRNQTWIPFVTLLIGALVGLADDWLDVKGKGGHNAGGLSLKKRIGIVAAIALAVGLWFHFKLDVGLLSLPFLQPLQLGWLIVPLFVLVSVGLYSGGVIDGIDGLAGGIFAIMFTAYGAIAFYQTQINLAAFCATVVGGLLAFLWFNIPPARFYMSETGTMALTMTLAVIAFMTDSLGGGHGIIVLPIVALPLVATSLSDIIQLCSKKFRNGTKVFRIAPLHHHFEALGWPPYKVTMRYWIIGVVSAIVGVTLALIG